MRKSITPPKFPFEPVPPPLVAHFALHEDHTEQIANLSSETVSLHIWCPDVGLDTPIIPFQSLLHLTSLRYLRCSPSFNSWGTKDEPGLPLYQLGPAVCSNIVQLEVSGNVCEPEFIESLRFFNNLKVLTFDTHQASEEVIREVMLLKSLENLYIDSWSGFYVSEAFWNFLSDPNPTSNHYPTPTLPITLPHLRCPLHFWLDLSNSQTLQKASQTLPITFPNITALHLTLTQNDDAESDIQLSTLCTAFERLFESYSGLESDMSLHVHVDLPFLRPIWDGLDKEKEDEDIADDEVQRERLREVRRMFQEVEGRWLERRNGGLKLVELDMDV